MNWGKARKKPIIVEFREPIPTWLHPNGIEYELIHTLEGDLLARLEKHFIIKGIDGELYPIEIEIFNKTYDVIEEFCEKHAKEDNP